MATKRKVTQDNFDEIKRFYLNHSRRETEWRFGISNFTINMISRSADYDDYVQRIKANHKKAYEARKGVNTMLGRSIHIPDNQGEFKSTTVYGSPFTETTVKEGADGSRTIVQKPITNKLNTPAGDMSTTMFIKACDMAKHGLTKKTISETLGYRDQSTFMYYIRKCGKAEEFEKAFAEGKEIRDKAVRKLQAQGRERVRAAGEWGKKGTYKKTSTKDSSDKAKATAAKNKGMTPEEYHQWQRDNLARARAKKKGITYAEEVKVNKDNAEKRIEKLAERSPRVAAAKATLESELSRYSEQKAEEKAEESKPTVAQPVVADRAHRGQDRELRVAGAFLLVCLGLAVLGLTFAVIWATINYQGGQMPWIGISL